MPEGIIYLDGPRTRRCLQAGLQQLISERDYLNRINVFPVADGDTGNNLAQTASAGLAAIAASPHAGAGATLIELANGMLDGAQGNSGVILTQFFFGLAETLHSAVRVDTSQFTEAMGKAAVATRASLEAPCEGTIISVIDAASTACVRTDTHDFAELVSLMLNAAEAALSITPRQLPELRKAGVVDAGGRGFCAFLQGCKHYLLSGSLRSEPVVTTPERTEDAFGQEEYESNPRYRYCTECLIAGKNITPDAVRHQLTGLGDCIVIAGSSTRLRIHIHTDNPEHVFNIAENHGKLLKTKADDMAVQARALQRSDRNVAIVTDSGADIPEAKINELGIHMVPLRVVFGDESHLDKISLSPEEFGELLNSSPHQPGTSQPTPGDFRRMFDFLSAHFGEVVSINLSNGLSGTYQGARAAAARCTGSDRITVLDSGTVSVGQGLIVIRAAKLAAEGMSGTKLHQQIEQAISSIRSFALVTDLSNAVRSGRVKPVVKWIADWLRLTPILAETDDGRIATTSFIPGKYRLVPRFARRIAAAVGTDNRWEIAICHGTDDQPRADHLCQELLTLLPESYLAWTTVTGAALGVHAGMEALIVALRPVGETASN